jgi:hypothetical protein
MRTTMPLEQARQYLARVIAWPQEGEPGWVNLHWKYTVEGDAKPRWGGRAIRTLDAAINALEFAQKSPTTTDIYVCMSSQSQAKELTSKKNSNFKFYTPLRDQQYVVGLKTLFLDIDIGAEKAAKLQGYATLNEAAAALAAFLKATGLPKPGVMVLSGGGLHVYWVFDRVLTRVEWQPLAAALKEATERLDFRCDRSVTTDSARILRVPDTLNFKEAQPRPVKLAGTPSDETFSVARIERSLEPFKVAVQLLDGVDLSLFPPRPALRDKANDELGAGVETAMPQPELRACLDVIPNNKTEWNFWNTVGMRVYAACDGQDYGLDEWKRWSAQNTQAGDKDSCEARWDTFHSSPPTRTGAGALINEARAILNDPKWQPRVVTSQVTQAATVAAAGAPAVIAPAPPLQTDLPDGYKRRADGIILRQTQLDAGNIEEIAISTYPMDDPWLQDEPKLLHFKTTVDRGRIRQIDLPLEIVATNEMRKALQCQGLMLPTGKKLEAITDFFMSWIKKLQETRESVASSPFGWSTSRGKLEGFVYGNRLWTPTGDRAAASPDTVLARQYAPVGDIQPWLDAVKLITSQGRPELEALVATAFGAPLVRFTGQPGVLMSAYSTASGIGKTTALKIAQAVWGDPIKAVQSLSDTQNSVMGKLGEIRSLPLYWDELKTEEDTKKFVNITFQTTQGKEKSRMTQAAKQREPGSWQTLLVSASNDSLLDYVLSSTNMTTAGLYRIFEYKMERPSAVGQIDSSDASLIVAKLHDNFGSVGYEYAQFLGQHHAQAEQDVSDYLRALGREVGAISDERYWLALIAVICVGAHYANTIGLTSFDLDALRAFLLGVLKGMRNERERQTVDMDKEINVTSILSQFLKAMRGRSTLITNRILVSSGRPKLGAIQILRGTAQTVQDVQVQYGVEDKILRFSSVRLSEWLKDKGWSRHLFTQALEKELGCRAVRGRLGGGTNHASLMNEHLLEIQIAGTALEKELEADNAAS